MLYLNEVCQLPLVSTHLNKSSHQCLNKINVVTDPAAYLPLAFQVLVCFVTALL
jgi:hypothetical protein